MEEKNLTLRNARRDRKLVTKIHRLAGIDYGQTSNSLSNSKSVWESDSHEDATKLHQAPNDQTLSLNQTRGASNFENSSRIRSVIRFSTKLRRDAIQMLTGHHTLSKRNDFTKIDNFGKLQCS